LNIGFEFDLELEGNSWRKFIEMKEIRWIFLPKLNFSENERNLEVRRS